MKLSESRIRQEVAKFQNGDSSSVDKIQTHVHPTVKHVAYKFGYSDDLDDFIQEFDMRLFSRTGGILQLYTATDANFDAYINRCAQNLAINFYRQKQRASIDSLDCILEEGHSPEALNNNDSVEQEMLQDSYDQVSHVLTDAQKKNSIPEDSINAFKLVYLHDFSYEQASLMLDIPIGTIRSKLNRTSSALRKHLETNPDVYEQLTK